MGRGLVPALPLTEVRARAASALAPSSEADADVLFDYPDAVTPPALVLTWDEPWLEAETMGPCLFGARFAVLAVVARIEPAIGPLEELIGFVVNRMVADAYSWPVALVQAPRWMEFGGVKLLGARIVYRVQVTTNGGTP